MGGAALLALALGAGWVLGLTWRQRLAAIAAVWAGVILLHLVLPAGAGLRVLLGGSAQGWLVLGGAAAVLLAYRHILLRLRTRAGPAIAEDAGPFRPEELDRYARHILLHEIGGPGQAAMKRARVLVIGAGGLGSPALLYLAASGVGTIGVVDDDVVEASNLQRQIIHGTGSIGNQKVASAAAAMAALNPHVRVIPHPQRLDEGNAAALIAEYDLVLDGTDNFGTRYLVNAQCTALGKPLISGAITQWEGQLSLFDPARGGPCYACVFPDRPPPGAVPTCAEAGVAAPLPGIIGAMMAMEAVKHLTGAGEGLRGRLMIHDALHGETRVFSVERRADCPVCAPYPSR